MSDAFISYMKEREGAEIYETEKGFATYIIKDAECYIKDIWVKPDFRQSKVASQLADKIVEIAKSNGCKYLTGSVCPSANHSTESLQVLLGYGMKLHSSTQNLIWFTKELF